MSETEQETATVTGPVYEVDYPGGVLWFPIDEYDLAYQHATGCKIGDERVDPDDEKSITITDFEGPVEVPIANV